MQMFDIQKIARFSAVGCWYGLSVLQRKQNPTESGLFPTHIIFLTSKTLYLFVVVKTIPRYFFYKSLRESRKLRNAILSLESDTEMLQQDKTSLEGMSEFEKSIFRDDDCSPVTNEDCLWEMIEEHSVYQDYLLKNLGKLRKFIPPMMIARYFYKVKRFDQAVNSIDPTYPVLHYSVFDNS